MIVAGVTMVRDEADIIVPVIRHMATQVDAIIVADNRSTDHTARLLLALQRELKVPIDIREDPEVGYEQARKMTHLAHEANRAFRRLGE